MCVVLPSPAGGWCRLCARTVAQMQGTPAATSGSGSKEWHQQKQQHTTWVMVGTLEAKDSPARGGEGGGAVMAHATRRGERMTQSTTERPASRRSHPS